MLQECRACANLASPTRQTSRTPLPKQVQRVGIGLIALLTSEHEACTLVSPERYWPSGSRPFADMTPERAVTAGRR